MVKLKFIEIILFSHLRDMNKPTLPSRKVPYKVFLDKDGSCLLEVKRQKYYLYEISPSGDENLLTTMDTGYSPARDEREEDYYLDYLNACALRKIDLLTTVFNYEEIILGINSLIQVIERKYSFRDFSMDQAYLIEDFKEVLNQLAIFTDDKEYYTRFQEMEKFFNTYFYDRASELNDEDKQVVITKLRHEAAFLLSLSVQ